MQGNSLKISSYNCRGLPKGSRDFSLRYDLKSLFLTNDIVCLQETWYSQQDLCKLNSLHSEFIGIGTSTVDMRDGICVGHPPGGVAIMYRKSISASVELCDFNQDWCTGINIMVDDKSLSILTIYMPYQCPENESEYLDKLGIISAILEDMRTSSFLIIGDWNANLGTTGQNLFAKFLTDFCRDHSLFNSSLLLLPNDSFSYVSDSWGSKSWLDHAVSSHDLHLSITSMKIGYSIAQEDHMPVLLTLSIAQLPKIVEDAVDSVKLNWDRLRNEDLLRYKDLTDVYLQE